MTGPLLRRYSRLWELIDLIMLIVTGVQLGYSIQENIAGKEHRLQRRPVDDYPDTACKFRGSAFLALPPFFNAFTTTPSVHLLLECVLVSSYPMIQHTHNIPSW